MVIKSWFLIEHFSQNERYAINCADSCTVERETEKAFLLVFRTEFGIIKSWFPKSVCSVEPEDRRSFSAFSVGDIVNHSKFGAGTVTGILAAGISVHFDCGDKVIAESFLSKAV